LAAATTIANSFYNGGGGPIIAGPTAGNSPFTTGIVGADISTFFGAGPGTVVVQNNSALQAAIVNCALVAMQSNRFIGSDAQLGIGLDATNGTPLPSDGAEIVTAATATPALGLFLEYPEDIHMWGASFNSTVGTWG